MQRLEVICACIYMSLGAKGLMSLATMKCTYVYM